MGADVTQTYHLVQMSERLPMANSLNHFDSARTNEVHYT